MSAGAGVSTSTRDRLVLALALVSGVTDSIGFLHLGGVFSSVMTGNIVLLGMSLSAGLSSKVLHTALAVSGFVAGCTIGAAVAGRSHPDDPVWPRRVSGALAVELVCFVVYGLVWTADSGRPDGAGATCLLALSAVALGIQSAAVLRLGVRSLSTTYFTGTLTNLVVDLAQGRQVRGSGRSMSLLASLVTGAVLGALAVRYLTPAAPLIQIVLLTAVLMISWEGVPGARLHRVGSLLQ